MFAEHQTVDGWASCLAAEVSAVRRHLPHKNQRGKQFITRIRLQPSTASSALSPLSFILKSLSRTITMSIWDSFTGGKKTQTASQTSENVQDPAAAFQVSQYNAGEAEDVSSFLNTPGAFDPASLHPLAGLNQDTLDYLNLDDSTLSDLPGARSALPSRGWSDDLCYGTGVTYLSALTVGGAWGLAEGLNRTPSTAAPKLRLNSALNAITRRGPFLGNSAGVIAMVYNGFNSTIGYYRGKHDAANSIAAGALSGMLFKSSRGIRPMMISGGIVASVAGAWAVSLYPGAKKPEWS